MQELMPALRPSVPAGFHFTPTLAELIRCYLNPWVAGKPVDKSTGLVCLADVYSADPDALTRRFRQWGYRGVWYFLCVARWKAGNKRKKFSRRVEGGGAWRGIGTSKPVGRGLGQRLGFEYRAKWSAKTVWIMEEISTSLAAAADGVGVKVVCKVYHPRKKDSSAAVAAADPDEEEETNEIGCKRPASDEYDEEAVRKRAKMDGLDECPVSVAPPSAAAEAYCCSCMGVVDDGAIALGVAAGCTGECGSLGHLAAIHDGARHGRRRHLRRRRRAKALVPVEESAAWPPMDFHGLVGDTDFPDEWWQGSDSYSVPTDDADAVEGGDQIGNHHSPDGDAPAADVELRRIFTETLIR